MDILILAEQANGTLHRATREAVAAAQALAAELDLSTAIALLGADPGPAATEAAALDVGEVLVARHELLDGYDGDLYTEAVRQLIDTEHPTYLLLGHTYQARDLVPKIGGRLTLPCLTDMVGYEVADGTPRFIKQELNNRVAAALVPLSTPCVVSFQAGAFAADAARAGSAATREVALTLDPSMRRCTAETPVREQETGDSVDLTTAELIVSIGRGLGKEENLPVVQALAETLGAELACSRPVVDAGWLPQTRQVGSSGQTVAPKLYLALGISGAAQHLVGMKGAATIIAINKDPEAPIFDVADYGVVADLLEVAPKLAEAVQ